MFGSMFGSGPLQANSFTGGIGDIQDALLQTNNLPHSPTANALDPVGTVEEEEDEIQRLQKMFGGGGGLVGDTLMGKSPVGKIAHMAMGSPMGMGGGSGLAGMLSGLFR